MDNSRQVLYALECSHAAPGPATLVSGVLRCAWHQEERQIIGVIEYEWRGVCRNCRFSRWAGLSKHNATIMARGHSEKHPAHIVHVEYSRNPTATRTAQKMRDYNGRRTA